MAFEYDGVKQLNADEVLRALKEKRENLIFLDVREKEEYDAGHIPGVQLLPVSEFVERFEQELDREKEYIVVCRSGNRSQMVCKFLHDQGFKSLLNFNGGMLEWNGPTESAE